MRSLLGRIEGTMNFRLYNGKFVITGVRYIKIPLHKYVCIAKAESPLGGKYRSGKISCSLIGYSDLLRRKILAA